jgi:hypothetical protein
LRTITDRILGSFNLQPSTFNLQTKGLDASTFPTDLLSAPTLANVSVTPESALGVPAVINAVSLISGALGSLPLEIFDGLTLYEVCGPESARARSNEQARQVRSGNEKSLTYRKGEGFILKSIDK